MTSGDDARGEHFRFSDTPHDVEAIRGRIDAALNSADGEGRVAGNANVGVYVFYDYDGEPIYVGQTRERLRTRIRRHLTNQRTDAVAMNVLDPFEVCEIEMWPFWEHQDAPNSDGAKDTLARAEYTIYVRVLSESRFDAVLNEKAIVPSDLIEMPPSSGRLRIIPDDLYPKRKHPDVRIARRAATIANLARVISERSVNVGLRTTLLTQARRLEWLSAERLREVGGEPEYEEAGEETGEELADSDE